MSFPKVVYRSAYISSKKRFDEFFHSNIDLSNYFSIRHGIYPSLNASREQYEQKLIKKHIEEIFALEPMLPGRFSRDVNALYTSKAMRSANEERRSLFKKRSEQENISKSTYTILAISISGNVYDYHTECGEETVPTRWADCQANTGTVQLDGFNIIMFRSLRGNVPGINYCSFDEEKCLAIGIVDDYVFSRSPNNKSGIAFSRVS